MKSLNICFIKCIFLIICLGTAAIAYSRIADNESVKVTACYDGQPQLER
jgi:hypothetical protein